MGQKTNRRAILVKLETTYGDDAAPAAIDAIPVRSVEPTPLNGELLENPLIRPEYGADAQVHVGTHVMLDIEVALAGSGTADVPPYVGKLLRMCGLSETVNAGTSVVYEPVSDEQEAGTIYFHHNKNLHKMTGARGTVQFDFDLKTYPIAKFKFIGLFSPVVSATLPAVDFSAVTKPVSIEQSNTPTFTVFTYPVAMEKFSIDLGNSVEFRAVLNGESVEITDRKTKGGITFESPNVEDLNWFDIIKANTSGAVEMEHGQTAGNIIEVAAPNVQLLQPKYGDSQGISTLEAQMSFIPQTGDDELVLTFR